MNTKKKNFGFEKGYKQLTLAQTKEFRTQLMGLLDIKSRKAWQARLKGDVEPKVTEADAITASFKRFGITDFWGK